MIKKIFGLLIMLSFLLSGDLAFAVNTTTCTPAAGGGGVPCPPSTGQGVTAKLENPIQQDTFMELISAFIKAVVQVAMPFIVFAFIWSGFLFVKAQGKEKELLEAKRAIYYSVLGAFILLGAWGFANIISKTVSTITGV